MPKMRLWLVRRIQVPGRYHQGFEGFVIAARTEKEARGIAADCAADEAPRRFWIYPKHATCEVLVPGDRPGPILSDRSWE